MLHRIIRPDGRGGVTVTTLVAVGLVEEAAGLDAEMRSRADVLELGVGKVNAATVLGAHLARHPEITRVVNLGTAGSLRGAPTGTVVEVGRVLQHDLDLDFISRLVGRDMPGGPIDLEHGEDTLATGDRFITDATHRDRLGRIASLVDMEGYAVAATSRAMGVDVRIVKCVSDDAGETAERTWSDRVADCAERLARHVRDTQLLGR